MTILKNIIREMLISLHLDLTQNLKYDRLTRLIMKSKLKKDHNCIDVGCHKGEILSLMLKYSSEGNHYAFEPIPYLYKDLVRRYAPKVNIYPYALSNVNGTTKFQLVKNALAYSGLRKRRYDIANPEIEEIDVELKTLDEVIPSNININFIKIDVEGAELGVLKGGINTLKRSKPLILFEFGKGASDFYGTTAADIYNLIAGEVGMDIYTLNGFKNNSLPLTEKEFSNHFELNDEYYFVAYFTKATLPFI